MVETELKFQVPAAARERVSRAVNSASAVTTRLRACYFDTPDQRLAAAGVALRLRQEGRVWVQTLKGPGPGLAGRLEHECRLPRAVGVPELDLRRHDDTAAAAVLRAALGRRPLALQMVFETDVRRTHRVLRAGAARIELALDVGHLRAQGWRAPLWELEFELLQGPLHVLYDTAARWLQRHGLWLDVRTKAERGLLLSRGQSVRAATGAQAVALEAGMTVSLALRAMVASALAQALPNAAAVAADVGAPDHLHQLRVGLRRLRSVWQLFGPLCFDGRTSTEDVPDEDPEDPLADVFRRLGAGRDRDVLATTLRAVREAFGAPTGATGRNALQVGIVDAVVDSDGQGSPGAVLREAGTGQLWLDWMAFADGARLHAPGRSGGAQALPGVQAADRTEGPDAAVPSKQTLAAQLARPLHKLDRRLARWAHRFDELDDDARHRLRRRIKRLRYGVEATRSLWPARAVEHYLAGLRPLADALGRCNDLQVARVMLEASPSKDREWLAFARGWVAAEHARALRLAAAALRRWPPAPKAWSRH
jgi:triphosphatase